MSIEDFWVIILILLLATYFTTKIWASLFLQNCFYKKARIYPFHAFKRPLFPGYQYLMVLLLCHRGRHGIRDHKSGIRDNSSPQSIGSQLRNLGIRNHKFHPGIRIMSSSFPEHTWAFHVLFLTKKPRWSWFLRMLFFLLSFRSFFLHLFCCCRVVT